MTLKNTNKEFGSLAKAFHWTIVALVLIQYGTFFYKDWFIPKGDELGGVLIGGLHKPFGVLTLLVAFTAFMWHLTNTKVDFPQSMPRWEKVFALFVHRALYLYLIGVASTGALMTVFGGRGIKFWGLFELAPLMEKQEEIADAFFEVHENLAYLGLALISLHFGGLLKQHFIRKEPIFRKMLPRFFFPGEK